MTEKEILYIVDMAALLGKTEAAVRGYVQRKSEAIPPWFHLGARVAWTRQAVNKWLADKSGKSIPTEKAKPGRPSKAQTVRSA